MTRLLGPAMVVCALLACSSKDGGGAVECAPGVGVMGIAPCACPDGVTMGSQSCRSDGTFTLCAPCGGAAGAGGAGTGGAPPIGTAGTGGAGTGGAGTGGAGTGGAGTGGVGGMSGAGGMAGDEDAGMEPPMMDAGADSGVDGGGIPAEGEQNSPCPNGNECNSAFGCYVNNHCTAMCTDDADCDGLSGANYTCFTMQGLCRVICTNDDDCPAGFECQNVAMGGSGMTLRCVLP